MLIRHC